MIDPRDIQFPCACEIFDGQKWEDAVCLGVMQEGSAMNSLKNFVMVWLVITKEGLPKKIYKIEHVRFSIFSNKVT